MKEIFFPADNIVLKDIEYRVIADKMEGEWRYFEGKLSGRDKE